MILSFLSPAWLEPVFMKKALFALLLIAPTAAAMGVHVLAMRLSYYTNTVSHSTFTGIALGLLMGIDSRISTLLCGLLVALLILNFSRRTTLSRDSLIGVLFSAVVSLGIVIVSMSGSLTEGFEAALYGDILGISNIDLIVLASVLVLTIIFEWVGFNRLSLIAINEPMAQAHGINVKFWEALLTLWMAVVVMVGLRIIGLLMITALLVVPAAAGRNMGKNAAGSMFWALIIALISAVLGLVLSYQFNSATGATVILISCMLFILTIPSARKKISG